MEKIIESDVIEGLQKIDAASVHTCVTSPPYYGLRDYGTEGQIGLEPSPEEYIDRLVCVFREVRRALRDDGTLWVNIGDSYAGSNGNGYRQSKWINGDVYHSDEGYNMRKRTARQDIGYKPKDLIGIPWMLAFALRADGWYLRQDIIWHKTNGMPESVKDRCTKSHEYIFLLSKSPRYYFDAEAISEPITASNTKRYMQNLAAQKGSEHPLKTNGNMHAALPRFGGTKHTEHNNGDHRKSGGAYTPTPRRNKRDVWSIGTASYKGAHFAVFPERLVEPCILAGCPVGGTVLDPFAGSGTTGVVAKKKGRNFVGIEINPEYCALASARIANTAREKEEDAWML